MVRPTNGSFATWHVTTITGAFGVDEGQDTHLAH